MRIDRQNGHNNFNNRLHRRILQQDPLIGSIFVELSSSLVASSQRLICAKLKLGKIKHLEANLLPITIEKRLQ
jgi:hypothetical protein